MKYVAECTFPLRVHPSSIIQSMNYKSTKNLFTVLLTNEWFLPKSVSLINSYVRETERTAQIVAQGNIAAETALTRLSEARRCPPMDLPHRSLPESISPDWRDRPANYCCWKNCGVN